MTQELETAYLLGYDADEYLNPFEADTPEHEAYLEGWQQSQDDW